MDGAKPKVVLLVDADRRSARILRRLLEDDGFAVEHAGDGASAIARLTMHEHVDALITDLRLAHADGAAVAIYARSRRPTVPVLVTTGYPERARGLRDMTPAAVILAKPIDYETLLDALRAATSP